MKSVGIWVLWFLLSLNLSVGAQNAQGNADTTGDIVSTREIERINWIEFKEVVPKKINTVLLPVGTLEPHGVVNNGADTTAPFGIAKHIAKRVNAMVAPALPYGITGSLGSFSGAFTISEEAYRPFVKQVVEGLSKNQFRNIIIINGHGGPQINVLETIAAEVSKDKKVRILVVNWFRFCADITKEVLGVGGGHGDWFETAITQAIDPSLAHPERYKEELAKRRPLPDTWAAYPFPTSIILDSEGRSYPKFDQKKADEYFAKVTDKIAKLIQDIIRKWDLAGL